MRSVRFTTLLQQIINGKLLFALIWIHNLNLLFCLRITANKSLPNKLVVMHDRFNDYNLGNTTLVLIYNNKKTKLRTQYQWSRRVSNFYPKKRDGFQLKKIKMG